MDMFAVRFSFIPLKKTSITYDYLVPNSTPFYEMLRNYSDENFAPPTRSRYFYKYMSSCDFHESNNISVIIFNCPLSFSIGRRRVSLLNFVGSKSHNAEHVPYETCIHCPQNGGWPLNLIYHFICSFGRLLFVTYFIPLCLSYSSIPTYK